MLGLGFGLCGLGFCLYKLSVNFFLLDRCLDAAGSFNYSLTVCDHQVSHPYKPEELNSMRYFIYAMIMGAPGFGFLLKSKEQVR